MGRSWDERAGSIGKGTEGIGMVGKESVEYGSWEGRERRGCEGRVGRGRD